MRQVKSSNSIEPVPYERRECGKRVCIMDTETDPFAPGRIVKPFSVGFFDGDIYKDFWGPDCIKQYFEFLAANYDGQELVIYAHNGGGFDFFFMLDFMDENSRPIIINGRLTKVMFQGQEHRDSFKIIPTSLASYQKDEIDYALFEADKREANKAEILAYQRTDCIYLYELVSEYHTLFGDQLTVGSTSIALLNSFYGFETFNERQDGIFRPFYFGGRNQCFESGILRPRAGARFQVYDVNSMYPAVMRDAIHPVSTAYELGRLIKPHTFFIRFVGRNYGALPTRMENGSLDFTVEKGEFCCTIHELNAGLDTGTIKIDRVKATYSFAQYTTFGEFIDYYYEARLEAKANSDKARDLFYKLLMNNSYGKFAQDPRKYSDYLFTIGEVPDNLYADDNPNGWRMDNSYGEGFMWAKPASNRFRGFRNVATAASITGAARASLLRGLSKAVRPLYCDTDSIVCESLGADLDDKRLGAWKHEATADMAAIAGKKLYCLSHLGKPVKWASKGAKLTPEEIISVANGNTVRYENPVPNFKLDGTADFVKRNIRATA